MKEINDSESLIKNENIISPFSFNKEENLDLIEIKKLKKNNCSLFFMIFLLILLLILILIFIIKYNIDRKKISNVTIINTNFTKSILDKNNYELIKLINGVEILLIQDTKTEISSASVVVNNGFLTDINNNGTAHLTMQTLFYRIKEELSNDLNQYFGGTSKSINNFYTSFNFYCLNECFYNILIKFGEIFTLIKKSSLSNDYSHIITDIDSDYNSKCLNNLNKEEHLIKYLVEGVHDENNTEILPEGNKNYYTENATTLNENIINYFNKYYYGENIKIVLFSNLKISLMRAYAIEAFIKIRNNTIKKTEKQHNFNTNKIISYSSDDSIPYMKIVYYFNGTENKNDAYINQGYLNYLNYILKSSDSSSCYNLLKKKYSFIRTINTFSNITFNNIIKYTIQVNFDYNILIGNEIEQIVIFIYNYIQNNNKNFFIEKAFDFLKNEYDKSFYFFEKKSNLENYVNTLALKLFWRKGNMDYYLYDNFLPKEKTKKEIIDNLVLQFKINNSIIILKDILIQNCTNTSIIFNKHNCNNIYSKINSTYFRLEYSYINHTLNYTTIKNNSSEKLINITNPIIYSTSYNNLIYPNILDKNEFIPTHDINLIYKNDTLSIFSKLDRTFKIPKVFVNIKLFHYLSRTNGTINEINANNIYNYLIYYIYLKLEIEEELREAILLGNEISVIRDDDCINIQIKAFSDIVKNIIDNIINIIYYPNENINNIKIYTLYLNNYLKQNDFNTYWQFIIKKNYYYNDIILKFMNKNEITVFNNTNNSMIVHVYFYGNINNSLLKNISKSFIERKANKSEFMDFLFKINHYISMKEFMELFQNITLPKDNYSVYCVEKDIIEKRIVQAFFYLGSYDKFKYITMNLLSKMFMNYNKNIKIEIKELNGLFIFFQVSNEFVSYEKLLASIDQYFNSTILENISSLYEIKNNVTKIPKFYYLINNFVQDINKDDLNLNDRAYDVINRLFYDKIPTNYNKSNITIYNIKELKKIHLKNLTNLFKTTIIQYLRKIEILIGIKCSKTRKSSIFEKVYTAVTKPLCDINTKK